MATIITCGTSGRDYSTLQAAVDAIPSTPTGGYEVHCYNDSEFTAGVVIDGHTTSPTDYIKITTGSGQSFMDHAGHASNPQYYDQSKGVGIRATVAFGATISVLDANVTIEKLQVHVDDFFGDCYYMDSFDTGNVLRNCILVNSKAHAFNQIGGARGGIIANNLMVMEGAGQNAFYLGGGLTDRVLFVANTLILTGTNTTTNAFECNSFTDADVIDCGVFGFAAISTGTPGTLNISYCGTDLGSGLGGGTGNTHSLTFADQFESTTVDFRLKTGHDMAFGQRQQTYTNDLDIVGQARSTSTPCVGQWEFQAGGGGGSTMVERLMKTRQIGLLTGGAYGLN